jgi:serine protease Do/serine protease DegQ
MIVKVDKRSPAEGAGLKVGDIVSQFASASVRDSADLRNRMGTLSIGDVVELTVIRNGQSIVIRPTIADQENNGRSK